MSDTHDEDGVVVGKQVSNPFGARGEVAPAVGGGLISVEQQRAVAEVQARMMIARANPRDVIRCMDLILQDCTRVGLAESALYQYSRGGSAISGPSIRLAENIARRWGNIASGIKELSRQKNGYSECVAYAWDLETGYYDERQFQVRHWRDTKKGGYQLTDERDLYELIANMGQRRKRAVLLTVMPGDVVQAAQDQCEETLKATADTSPAALLKMVNVFSMFGVSREQIEARCQCRLEAIRPAQVIQLRKIHASLKDGMSDADDWFDPIAAPTRAAGAKLDKFEQKYASGKTTDVAFEPFIVADHEGEETSVSSEKPGWAARIYQDNLVVALKQADPEAAVRAVMENNTRLFEALDTQGHTDLSVELGPAYAEAREAAAAQVAAKKAAEAKPKAERKKAAPQQETPQEAQQPEQQPGPSPEVEQEEPGATEPETEAEAMPVERNDFWSRATFQIDLPTKQGGAPNFQLLRDTLMMLVEQVDSAVELAKFAADNEVHLRRLKDAFPSYETLVTTKFMEIGKRLAGGQ